MFRCVSDVLKPHGYLPWKQFVLGMDFDTSFVQMSHYSFQIIGTQNDGQVNLKDMKRRFEITKVSILTLTFLHYLTTLTTGRVKFWLDHRFLGYLQWTVPPFIFEWYRFRGLSEMLRSVGKCFEAENLQIRSGFTFLCVSFAWDIFWQINAFWEDCSILARTRCA